MEIGGGGAALLLLLPCVDPWEALTDFSGDVGLAFALATEERRSYGFELCDPVECLGALPIPPIRGFRVDELDEGTDADERSAEEAKVAFSLFENVRKKGAGEVIAIAIDEVGERGSL